MFKIISMDLHNTTLIESYVNSTNAAASIVVEVTSLMIFTLVFLSAQSISLISHLS